MKKLLALFIILILNSCSNLKENGIELTIKNNSDATIENLTFSTSENLSELKFESIEPQGTISDYLTMKDNKSDGSYILEFTRNGEKKTQRCGYYTNGIALDAWVEFKIENDTITWQFSGM